MVAAALDVQLRSVFLLVLVGFVTAVVAPEFYGATNLAESRASRLPRGRADDRPHCGRDRLVAGCGRAGDDDRPGCVDGQPRRGVGDRAPSRTRLGCRDSARQPPAVDGQPGGDVHPHARGRDNDDWSLARADERTHERHRAADRYGEQVVTGWSSSLPRPSVSPDKAPRSRRTHETDTVHRRAVLVRGSSSSLDMGPVVLVAGPRPREGDLVRGAVGEQVGVDELRAVVGVDPENRERELGDDLLDRLEHPDRSLVLHRAIDSRACRDVGEGEREAELAARVAPLVADEVDLDEPGFVLVPLGPGADRDLGLEQRAGLGVRTPSYAKFGPLRPEMAIDARRAHGHKQRRLVVVQHDLAVTAAGRRRPGFAGARTARYRLPPHALL